jgi:hypothetical protein
VAAEDDTNLEDLTVADLRARASELDITGRSSMNKDDLVQAVADAEEQMARLNGDSQEGTSQDAESSGSHESEAEADEGDEEKADASDGDDENAEDRPWREGSDSDDDDAGDLTAPSIGPNTHIEHVPPEERLDMDKISDVDAMGLDKRRQVGGQRYGASPLKQVVVYGLFFLVLAALVVGGKIAADKLDQPPDTVAVKAPWAEGDQKSPAPIDFPRTTDPD